MKVSIKLTLDEVEDADLVQTIVTLSKRKRLASTICDLLRTKTAVRPIEPFNPPAPLPERVIPSKPQPRAVRGGVVAGFLDD